MAVSAPLYTGKSGSETGNIYFSFYIYANTGQSVRVITSVEKWNGSSYDLVGNPETAERTTSGSGNTNSIYLSAGSYRLQYYSFDSNSGENSTVQSETFTISDPYNPPSTPTGVSATAISTSQINISWNSVSNADAYYIELNGGTIEYTYNTYYYHKYLTSNTTYKYRVKAMNGDGESAWSSYVYATTDGLPPSNPSWFLADAVSSSQIDLSWASSQYADGYYLDVWNGSSWSNLTTTTSRSYSHTGLAENTYYEYRVRAYNSDGSSSGVTTSETTLKSRPSNFSWHTAKISGEPFNCTANEWNDFLGRINEFRQYKGLSTYGSFTIAVTGDYALATQINQARTAINDMSPPTAAPSSVSSGGICLASTLNGLRDSLNSIS